MRRSKLEMYLDILAVLAQKGPLKLTHIMYKGNVNCSVLKEYLAFLMQNNLIEEKTTQNQKIIYCITEKGNSVLKYYRELQTLLPFDENKQQIPAILF